MGGGVGGSETRRKFLRAGLVRLRDWNARRCRRRPFPGRLFTGLCGGGLISGRPGQFRIAGSVWSSRKTSLWVAAATEPLRFLPGELGDKGADGLLLGTRPEPARSLPQHPTTKSPTEPGEGPDEALARAEAGVGPGSQTPRRHWSRLGREVLPAPPDRGRRRPQSPKPPMPDLTLFFK